MLSCGNGRLEFVCDNIYEDTTIENSDQLSSDINPNETLVLSSLLSSDKEIRTEHSSCNDSSIDTADHLKVERDESKANFNPLEQKLNNDLLVLKTSKPFIELNISSGSGSTVEENVDKSIATPSVFTSRCCIKNIRTQDKNVEYFNHHMFSSSNILQYELSKKEIRISEKLRKRSNEIRQNTSCSKSRRMALTASEQSREKIESLFTDETYTLDLYESQSRYSERLKRYESVEKIYEFKLCDRKNPNLSDLKVHAKIHPKQKRYQCKICRFECSTIRNLIKHKTIYTGETPFCCEICGVQSTRKGGLHQHMIIHSGEKPFKCEICGAKFMRNRALQEHARIHTGEKPFFCKICGDQFSRKRVLQRHIQSHAGEKNFLCEICGVKFTQKVHLQEHMRIHTGEKPFECQICGVKFTRKVDLRKHKIVHTGEKPFDCDICGVQFSRKGVLHKHMRKHTGEKPFNCDICGVKFTRKDVLQKHMRIHTGEKPFNCEICGVKFTQKPHLQRHMGNHTGKI